VLPHVSHTFSKILSKSKLKLKGLRAQPKWYSAQVQTPVLPNNNENPLFYSGANPSDLELSLYLCLKHRAPEEKVMGMLEHSI
jgi:hypothetical protein